MNDQNLDDLIIDNISPKNSKTKSFLTVIALAIVMLIIAIILTKIILKDPQSEQLSVDDNTVYVSPELTLESIDKKEEIVKAPHIPTTEEIKPAIKVSTPPVDTVKITNTFADTTTETAKRSKLESEAEEAQKQIEINEAKAAEAKAQAIAEAKAKAQARAAQKAAEAKRAEVQAKKEVDQERAVHPYFIQVGSFSKTPSDRFLNIIKNSGFHYLITTPSTNGSKKLLIGPYSTKPAADQALAKVKDRINKSAYIIRK